MDFGEIYNLAIKQSDPKAQYQLGLEYCKREKLDKTSMKRLSGMKKCVNLNLIDLFVNKLNFNLIII